MPDTRLTIKLTKRDAEYIATILEERGDSFIDNSYHDDWTDKETHRTYNVASRIRRQINTKTTT